MTNSTMTNIIYNFFLQKYFSQDVDLEKDSYKLALFKESYTPNINKIETYGALSGAGLECEDGDPLVSDNPNKGYKKGGVPVTFSLLESSTDIYKKYSCGDVVFNDYLSLSGDNTACYAIIYRVSDGLLVSCFPFDRPITLNKEGLTLSWADVATVQISADLGVVVDTALDPGSINPVQNRVIVAALDKYSKSLETYGVRFNDEDIDDNPETDDNKVDTLNRINENTIEEMFNED